METTVRGVRDADTGAVRETQSAARDINARKEIEEELRRSNTELEEFAAVASHDLAAPLATMAGYAEVLRSQYGDALGHGGATLVARITGNATRMRGLIDDLLDLAHAGSGNLVHEPVALETVVEEVLAALDGRIEETGAQVDASGLPVVEGDRGLLTRLFLNLIGNALKFVAPGTTPEVSVTARRAGLHWAVGVCDRGIGLPAEGSEQAFEAFRRLHAGDSYQGTGLGLSICRRIARAHGGEITAERRGGGGTIFTVTLPAAD
jgi:signal transduction histidine kinase